MKMIALQALTKVRAFLSVRENWCQGSMTTNGKNGCLIATLIDFIGRDVDHPVITALLNNAPKKWKMLIINADNKWQSLSGINDTGTHQDVLDWLDRTIASEKAKSGVEALKGHLTAKAETIDTPANVASAKLELVH